MATNAYTATLLNELHEQLSEHITDEARETIADNEQVNALTMELYDVAVSAISDKLVTPYQALYAIDAANVALSIATSARYISEQYDIPADVVLDRAMSEIKEG